MMPHPTLSLLCVMESEALALAPRLAHLEHEIPATEMTPGLTVHQRRAEGETVRIVPSVGESEPYAFHRNRADHLLRGEPITAPLADSVEVVAILEAAARSMSRGDTLEVINGG